MACGEVLFPSTPYPALATLSACSGNTARPTIRRLGQPH